MLGLICCCWFYEGCVLLFWRLIEIFLTCSLSTSQVTFGELAADGLISQRTAWWSDMPGRTYVRVILVGLFVIMRSRVLFRRVGVVIVLGYCRVGG